MTRARYVATRKTVPRDVELTASCILQRISTRMAGLLSQFAQQSEAQEVKTLLVKIDRKLDDVRRASGSGVLLSVAAVRQVGGGKSGES